jgi:hypothetical protein
MPAQFLEQPPTRIALPPPPSRRADPLPDLGFAARERLTRLESELAAVLPRPRSRWKEPALFFFDRRREAQREANRPVQPVDPLAAISARIAAELPSLRESVEVRRVARALVGLRAAVEALAPRCPTAQELLDLLAIPDDEVILVLHPGQRAGFRLAVRGVADVGQFHVLLAAAIAADSHPRLHSGPAIPQRLVAACHNRGPSSPAGVPMIMEACFQIYTHAAIQPDGTLPQGLRGCDHWLWPAMPLAAVPRVAGERVVLLGPPAYRASWEVGVRFPGLVADLRVVEVLGPFRVAEQLTRLTGKPIVARPREEQGYKLAKAA